MSLRRAYSQLVSSKNGIISVIAPHSAGAAQTKPQNDTKLENPRSVRDATLDKIRRGILYEKLNTTQRHAIFRPSNRNTGSLNEKKVIIDGKQVLPTKYPGIPGVDDLTKIIETVKTPQQLKVAFQIVHEYTEHKKTMENLRQHHIAALLRKAAEVGEFTAIYSSLTNQRYRFKQFLNQHFYLDSLRIYCLRVPFLNHNSKNMFYRMHMRGPISVGRDLCLIYALACYGVKFGPEHAKRLETLTATVSETLKNIIEKQSTDRTNQTDRPDRPDRIDPIDRINTADLAIGLEGARMIKATELEKLIEQVLERGNQNGKVLLTVKTAVPEPESPAAGETVDGETVESK